MDLDFRARIWFWRGPAPWYFVTVPEPHSLALKAVAGAVTYGWGMIPVRVRLGKSEWETALWPKDGSYIVPLRTSVRKAEQLDEDDEVSVRLTVRGVPGAGLR